MASDSVQIIQTDIPGVVEVRLNRPEKHNALNTGLFSSLAEAGDRLKTEPGLRAVVISGNGRSFCAGLDMGNFANMAEGGGAGATGDNGLEKRTHGISNLPQYIAMVWREVPVPVIAAVQGVAVCRWRWVPICGLPHRTPSGPLWRSSGAWCRTWAAWCC